MMGEYIENYKSIIRKLQFNIKKLEAEYNLPTEKFMELHNKGITCEAIPNMSENDAFDWSNNVESISRIKLEMKRKKKKK